MPRMTVITRKAYGGAYLVMNSKHLRADVVVRVAHGRDRGDGRRGRGERRVPQARSRRRTIPEPKRAELIERVPREVLDAVRRRPSAGFIDDVIEPAETRPRLIKALRMLSTKREAVPARKHGNIPL